MGEDTTMAENVINDGEEAGFGIEDVSNDENEEDIDRNRGEDGEASDIRERLRIRMGDMPVAWLDQDDSGTYNPQPDKKAKGKGKASAVPIPKDRKTLTCTECRLNGIECSLQNWSDQPPCDTCRISGTACTFISLRDARR
jgi:hypothetical protein